MIETFPIFGVIGTTAALVTVAAATAVAAGAKAYGDHQAAKAQLKALSNVDGVNIEAVSRAALAQDRERFEQQFAIQRELDPTYARLREEGAQELLGTLTQDDSNIRDLEGQLVSEALLTEPQRKQRQELIGELLNQAEEDLGAGATLPAEFQAELVRAGLETGGASGTGASGQGVTGTNIRRLLGRAGLELRTARQNQATNLISAADAIKTGRAAILSGVLSDVQNRDTTEFNRAITATGIGSSAVPQAGLSGADITNLALVNSQIQNNKAIARGNIQAQQAQVIPNLIGGLAGAASTGVSGYAQMQGLTSPGVRGPTIQESQGLTSPIGNRQYGVNYIG